METQVVGTMRQYWVSEGMLFDSSDNIIDIEIAYKIGEANRFKLNNKGFFNALDGKRFSVDECDMIIPGSVLDIIPRKTQTQAVGTMKIVKRYKAERGLLFRVLDGSIVDAPEADRVAKANALQYAEYLTKAYDGMIFGVNEDDVIIPDLEKKPVVNDAVAQEIASNLANYRTPENAKSSDGMNFSQIEMSDIFGGGDNSDLTSKLDGMAQFAAVEEDAIGKMEDQIAERKANLDKIKSDMAEIMLQNGMKSVKLSCGLSPSAEVKTKFFKANGVEDVDMFDWLKSNSLGDIIKPYVHFQSLQSTMRTFRDQGGEIPSVIFNVTEYKTVRMNGKSKFLAARNS